METRKTNIAFILSLLFIFSLGSCKKYEDGPLISLRPKNLRLVGVWEVAKLEDAFSGDKLNPHSSYQLSGNIVNVQGNNKITIEIEKDGKFTMKVISHLVITTSSEDGTLLSTETANSTALDAGEWSFTSDKESIRFKPSDPFNSVLFDFVDPDKVIYDVGVKIHRLTKKEFNFVDDYSNSWELTKQ